ncbi:MAG TPA: ABC transporter permease [Vicinamibacterales bacterium]|nr:ABC transporter permease [Vicinamibacterales bacterium]
MAIRAGLLDEIVRMAFDTVRTNKLRSGLTVLGIVIGITALVGMTAIIKGFDESLRDMMRELGPKTIFVAKWSGVSVMAGKEFKDLIKRPVLTVADARAIARECPTVDRVDVWLGAWGISTNERIFYRSERTKPLVVFGATENFAAVNFVKLEFGRFFNDGEVQRRRQVVVLGQTAYQTLFKNIDPIDKKVRVGRDEYTVVGVLGKRPSPGGFNVGADDFVVIPYTTHQKFYGNPGNERIRAGGVSTNTNALRSAMIAIVPREEVSRDEAMAEVRTVMRIRHGLRLDQEDDFDIMTQEAGLKIWDQFSQATFLALVVISSIALMVGGIGVTAIMTISVTERTREIGLRKALGARRQEVLWQFLFEAVFLTSVGGLIGILFGSGIGVAVHYFTGFPVFLPWWSFALGFAFSAIVGIFFGMWPAIRASRLDPIEALRYE